MAARFATAGLTFAGSATTFQNYVDLAFPPALQGKARGCTSRLEIEALRDFIRNETFRKDVYVRADTQMAADAWQAALRTQPVGATAPSAQLDREVAFGDVAIQYDGEVFDPVIAAASVAAASARDLAGAIPGLGEDMASDALAFLVAGGQFQPFLHPTTSVPVPSRIRIAHDTTRRLIDWLALSEGEATVVAPALGGGLRLGATTAMLLRALDAAPEDPVGWLMTRMEETGHHLAGLTGEDAFSRSMARQTLEQALAEFRDGWLPKLVEVGVVAAG